MYAVSKLQKILKKMGVQMLRSVNISHTKFNIDALSDEECYRQFRFQKKDLPNFASIIGWSSNTETNRCKCEQLTAASILRKRLAYPCRWKDLELQFGMHESGLSEVFHVLKVRLERVVRESV